MFDFIEWNPMDEEIVDVSGDDDGAVYHWSSLPFYEETTLVRRMVGKPFGTSESYWLSINDELYELNGESSVIHWANDEERLDLRARDAPAYLTFFSHFVKGSEGAFLIVASADDASLAGFALPEELRGLIRPLSLDGIGVNGGYAVSGFLRYGDAFYRASFEVSRDGCVSMTDDECLFPADRESAGSDGPASG